MSHRKPLPESLGPHFARREAEAAGAAAGRLRAGDLQMLFRGGRSQIRETVPPNDRFERERLALAGRCAAYTPVAPHGSAFSHTTAAILYRMPLPERVRDGMLHVTVPPGVRAPRRPGVVGHTAGVPIRTGPLGLTVVDPVTAWLQVARQLSIDEIVVAGDFLVRRKGALSSLALLHAAVDDSSRVRGIRAVRAALLDVRADTDSPPESETRLVLVRAGLPEPIVHHTVYDADGFFVGTPDLAYIEARIAIEYQGKGHRQDPEVFEDDIVRRELFRRAGWHVFLVTSRTLKHPSHLAAEMRSLLEERRPRR